MLQTYMFKKSLIKTLPAVICGTLLAATIVYAWTPPTADPPGGNVPAPINIGNIGQIKSGPLEVNGFRNIGATRLDGNVGIGKAPTEHKLDIGGDINIPADGFLRIAGSEGSSGQVLARTDSGMAWQTMVTGGEGYWALSGTDIYNTNTGNVGIKTDNPQAPLNIGAPSSGQELRFFTGINSFPEDNAPYIATAGPDLTGKGAGTLIISPLNRNQTSSEILFMTSQEPRMVINTFGNVGIGLPITDSPLQSLDVRGNTHISGNVGIGTTNPGSTLTVRRSDAGTALAIRNTGDTANTFTVSNTGSAHMTGFRLGSSATAGHVLTTNASGVGTWQPVPTGGGGMTVACSHGQVLHGMDVSNGLVMQGWCTGATSLASQWTLSNNSLYPNEASWNVGIGITPGTAPANEKIEVAGNIRLLGNLWFRDAHRYIGTQTNHNLYLRTNNADRVTILNTGNVGIGATNPGERLDVNGNVRASAFFYSSDISLKENIKPLEDSLAKILQLNGISYQMKETGAERIGFSAQEVAQIFPELVNQDKNGLLSMESNGLTAALVEAVKAQQAQIDELKAEIEQLKNQ